MGKHGSDGAEGDRHHGGERRGWGGARRAPWGAGDRPRARRPPRGAARAEVERLRDEALRAFGRVDVWINNAGRGISRPVLELTDQDVDEMMSVNVKSALYGMQAIVPHFQERGEGHLIN